MPGTTVTELEHLDSPLLERQRREALYNSHAVSGAKIRVFIVETAEESTIRGELQVVDLDDADPIPGGFDALSYCWGKPDDEKLNVLCSHSNVKIPVTPSCISAISHIRRLRSRRHRRGNVTPLAIWIDAICINQDDDAPEKPQQLSLIGRIYANAKETYFWLGPGNKSTDKAMKYLRNGFVPSQDSTPWSNAFRIWWYLFSFHWSQLQPGLDKVFSQDWINRVWTLQHTLLSTELFLKTDSLDHLLIGEYYGHGYASWVIDWGSSPRYPPLPEWNIGWMGRRNWTGRQNWINSVLQHLDQRKEALQWLKWLNFRYYRTYNGFIRFTGATPDSKHQWDEANKTRLRHRRIQDGIESVDLVVQGRIISEISSVKSKGEVFNQYTDLPKCDLEYESLMAFQESILGLEKDEVFICVKYMLLLVGLNSQVENEFTATFEGIDAWREILQEEDRVMRKTQDQFRRKHAAKNIQLGLSLLVHHMDISLARCSGSDYKGFGISTRDVREGDSVALISGVSLPMVVRMNSHGDGKFRVVGPAFFGGLMDGKVWRRSVEKGLEEIILC